jgi:hypothetical protein
MLTIEDAIKADEPLRAAFEARSINDTNDKLRAIMDSSKYGLGVAILVAWRHGLKVGHIPVTLDDKDDAYSQARVRKIEPSEGCPYTFVHVPVRQFRRNTDKLAELRILNRNADPGMFVYHEDGLIGTFSFQNPRSLGLTDDDISEILRSLAQQGVLVQANIDNRQIQFKDLAVKRRIEESNKAVYVRISHKPLEHGNIFLPTGYDREDIWKYIAETLKYRFACNYCSVQALSPLEAILNSAAASVQPWNRKKRANTVRNYQLGFTFSPVGDPQEVCHFLAWDFPHISDLVMNMEPQDYSFSDLILLVQSINRDTDRFYRYHDIRDRPAPITGACNHWAGNSIYHQHYQFFSITGLPMLRAIEDSEILVTYMDTEVRRLGSAWPTPAFVIRSLPGGTEEGLMRVADKVASEWRVLADGEDHTYGNKIVISSHTQNILVTIHEGSLIAIFIPRLRLKVSTSDHHDLQKKNAGVLEMMGYFVIDSPKDFDTLCRMHPDERRNLGDSWLRELAPDHARIDEFEENVKICLSAVVDSYEQRVGGLASNRPGDWRTKARELVTAVKRDHQLDPGQREHLYRELVWALLEPADGDNEREAAE